MKKLFTSFILLFLAIVIYAQDTVVVQTLTFDSITTRRGVWQFPEGEEYRKILMYYTLKCDQQTQHDQYQCGEWDYLTYTNVWEHTDVWDSTLYFHPNFTYINERSADSVLVRNDPAYTYYRRSHKTAIFDDTLSISQKPIGEGNVVSDNILATSNLNGRTQFLWQASELFLTGLTEGNITGIKLNIDAPDGWIKHLTIKMGNSAQTELTTDNLNKEVQTVYFNELVVSGPGWYDFNFVEPFYWDGASGIVVELSFETSGKRQKAEGKRQKAVVGIPLAVGRNNINIYADEIDWDCGISSFETNYALNMDGEMDFMDCADATYFNGDFTVEFWMYKRNNNKWSRVFDFGNGPNKNNVIITYSNGTSGKLSVHVNNQDGSKSYTMDDALPLNQWVHVAVRLSNNIISWLYINGEQAKMGILQQPNDITRTINYIGRSNWSNDTYADGMIDEFRIYNYARDPEEIQADFRKPIENPQSDPGLVLYYQFNEGEGTTIYDASSYGLDANTYGYPLWHQVPGPQKYLNFQQNNIRPQIIFETIEYSSLQEVVDIVMDSTQNSLVQIIKFEDVNDPTIPTDTISIHRGGYMPVYDSDTIYEQVWFDYENIMYKEDLPYYGEPFEIIERHEIGRFITPYGINLSLGPQGFMWIYDVTDYAQFLKGDVDLSAGNQQELIDIKFVMIKGTPPREVLKYDRIWGPRASYSYKSLDSNFVLQDTTYVLLPETKQAKVKTRFTGHGHNSNNGDYPHCCEWKDNTHYLLVNGDEIANWHIFQYHDCAWNPVFPQGGTWPGAREGWCPGDLVKEHNWEITEYISNNEVTLDYAITPVPPNNLGMGNGNYVVAMHLFQYDEANYSVDAELYDVVTPNNYEYYSRQNPICSNPTVIIRNNGTEVLTSLEITYGVSGGDEEVFHWTGNLASNLTENVVLPISGNSFWLGDGSNIFNTTAGDPNEQPDQYADNNSYQTHFEMPDLYSDTLVVRLKTNNQAHRYTLTIWDVDRNIVFSRDNMENNTIYNDTLWFSDGCYTMELLDSEDMGLTYWAYPAQGNGYLRLLNTDDQIIKMFQSEFGHKIHYTFSYGEATYIQEPNLDSVIDIYPNPASDVVNIRFHDLEGQIEIKIYDIRGIELVSKEKIIGPAHIEQIDLSGYPAGIYVVNVYHNSIALREKIIKK